MPAKRGFLHFHVHPVAYLAGALAYILSSCLGSLFRVLRPVGPRSRSAACTLDGRHIAPPRRVGTPSALSWSAIACSVMLALRIALMRSSNAGRSATAARPVGLPAGTAVKPLRLRRAMR